MDEAHRQHVIRQKVARLETGGQESIPLGFRALDEAIGGLPRGRIVEVFGASGSGKTTLALQIIANIQASGGAAAWIDAEHAFDAAYAARLGVALDRMPVAQPESAEEALEILRRLALSQAVDLLVVDSAAALVPEIELQTGIGKSGPGTQSRVLASGLRKLAAALRASGAAAIFLNQTRAAGEGETSAGGAPLKLFAAARISLRVADAGRIRFRVLKNKAAEAFREGDLFWENGAGFVERP